MLTGPKKTGRVAKWAIELGEHDIVFLRRNEKETPADFLVEIPFEDNNKKEKPKEYTYALRFEFETTNNEEKYEALLAGLRIAQEMEIAKVAIFLDSQLLVDMQERKSWMNPIHEYLLSGLLPEDTKEARKIRIQAPQYKLIQGNVYKRSFFTPWLRCVAPPQTDKIIKEIHEGSCGFNAEPRSLVVRITKQCYYWPSMHREVAKAIQDCEKCKEQSAIRKARTSGVIAAGSTWPFSHWGIHILGLLPMAPGGLQFLAIAVEHSTKWVEAKLLTTKNGGIVEKFVWEYVVCSSEYPG
ncbi:reverse transcriptase domain-containing protein [Tanacetum coccineum]